MGTYQVDICVSVGTKTGEWEGENTGADAELIAGINNQVIDAVLLKGGKLHIASPSAVGTWLIRFGFDQNSDIISLDGAPHISYNNLPAGFGILADAVLTIGSRGSVTTGGSSLKLQSGPLTESAALPFVGGIGANGYVFALPVFPVPTMLDIINDGFGIETTYTGATDFSAFYFARITGTYTTFAFSWDMSQDGENAAVGELITITSEFSIDPANSMDLTHVTLSMACGIIVPIIQTTDLFTFLVPDSCDDAGLQTLTATGDGTQFSGSVALGTLTILLTNASGIYTLVPGKRQDTYYSSHRDGTTVDIKIPDPTGRTGFVGG